MNEEAHYQVKIGFPGGYQSTFDAQYNYLSDENGNIITRMSGFDAITGQLGNGVDASSYTDKKIPAKLSVMWFSLTENKFYRGSFDLPKKEIIHLFKDEKILGLFTVEKTKTFNTYDELVVNVAPRGKVYVYARGYAAKLIAVYQAKEIEYDWKEFLLDNTILHSEVEAINTGYYTDPLGEKVVQHIDTRDEAVARNKKIDETSSNVEEDQKYFNLYKNYDEGYFKPVHWTLKLEGPSSPQLLAYLADTLNGERTPVLKDPLTHVITSIPKEIAFDFKDKNEVKRLNIIFPNLYQLYTKNFVASQPVQIIIGIPNADQTSVHFKQGNKEIEVEKGVRVQELSRD